MRATISRRRALQLAGVAGLVGIYPGRRGFAADAVELAVEAGRITVDGEPRDAVMVGGSVPGPTLTWREGEEAVVRVTNRYREPTAIHWHGLLIDPFMDGVPGFNGFPGIPPGETFTYRFRLRQAGTYWYHSHAGFQEQAGVYGALVIRPAGAGPAAAERDHVVVLSDHPADDPDRILRKLKADAGYYNYGKRTLADFLRDAGRDGTGAALRERAEWGGMRMDPTDLADVTGYSFLVNGHGPADNWTGLFTPGERVRLRFVNASGMSFYDVRIPGLAMIVVGTDGQPVQPVAVDEFRIGVAETYDVMVQPAEARAYSIVAEPIDRSGFARATLAPQAGMAGPMPEPRPRTVLTMADMGLAHEGMDHAAMGHAVMGHAAPDHSKMDHSKMGHARMGHAMPAETPAVPPRGWADAQTPAGMKALGYADLVAAVPNRDRREPTREIELRLTGLMERYIWTLNGSRFGEDEPIRVAYGERVRIRMVNTTMMAHPMHLHGMFVELENGAEAGRLPLKHTVVVPPGATVSVLLTADEPGEWPFHCHLLYHMMAGMMTRLVVAPKTAALGSRHG